MDDLHNIIQVWSRTIVDRELLGERQPEYGK